MKNRNETTTDGQGHGSAKEQLGVPMSPFEKEATAYILGWMQEFLEVGNPHMDNWAPCPYVKAARLKEKIEFVVVDQNLNECPDPIRAFNRFLVDNSSRFSEIVSEGKDVLLLIFRPEDLPEANMLTDQVVAFREQSVAFDQYLMFDHPAISEKVAGGKVDFGNKKYAIVMFQKFSALNEASESLRSIGYYEAWDKHPDSLAYQRSLLEPRQRLAGSPKVCPFHKSA